MVGPQLVPLPARSGDGDISTLPAGDQDTSESFIISCKLSVVIDSLLPLLGTHKNGIVPDRSQILLENASRDIDSLGRCIKTEAGSGK